MNSPWDDMPPGLKTYYDAIANKYCQMRDALSELRDEARKNLKPSFVREETASLKRDIKKLTRKMDIVNQKLNFLINDKHLVDDSIRIDKTIMQEEISPIYHSARLYNVLYQSPYTTYGEVFKAGSTDLISLRLMGKGSLNELREFFHLKGYVLL